MADETRLTAASRLEKLLDNIAGGDNDVTPATRLEKFLSYIADAMEGGGSGGGVDCVKVITGYGVDTSEHPGSMVFGYTPDGWRAVSDLSAQAISSMFNTDDEIPTAYVLNTPIATDFPLFIRPVDFFVTGETHQPLSSDDPGYYIEYADEYSTFFTAVDNAILVIKNGVVSYHGGHA